MHGIARKKTVTVQTWLLQFTITFNFTNHEKTGTIEKHLNARLLKKEDVKDCFNRTSFKIASRQITSCFEGRWFVTKQTVHYNCSNLPRAQRRGRLLMTSHGLTSCLSMVRDGLHATSYLRKLSCRNRHVIELIKSEVCLIHNPGQLGQLKVQAGFLVSRTLTLSSTLPWAEGVIWWGARAHKKKVSQDELWPWSGHDIFLRFPFVPAVVIKTWPYFCSQ